MMKTALLALMLLLAAALPARAAPSVVSSNTADCSTTSATCSFALTGVQAQDDIFLFVIYYGAGNSVSSVTSSGAIYARRKTVAASPYFFDSWNGVVTGATPGNITVTLAAVPTGGLYTVSAIAVRGLFIPAPFDPNADLPLANTEAGGVMSVTTTDQPDIIIGCYSLLTATNTAGTGWTPFSGSGANYTLCEYQIVSAAQSALAVHTGTDADNSTGIGDALTGYSGGVGATCFGVAGCGAAYSLDRVIVPGYAGPLFQLENTSSHATLAIGAQANGTVDLSTWSAFCGGVQSDCDYSVIYDQSGNGNNLVPSVFNATTGGGGTNAPNCSAGGLTCAAPFALEAATGLPVLGPTAAPQQYTLANDYPAVGLRGYGASETILTNTATVATAAQCCSWIGTDHPWNAPDTAGTDFGLVMAYGRPSNTFWATCGTVTTYCLGTDYEESGDGADYGSSPLAAAVALVEYDSGADLVAGYINGAQIFSKAPAAAIDQGTSLHLGGGGDLSQPAKTTAREWAVYNAALTPAQIATADNNIGCAEPALSFSGFTPSCGSVGAILLTHAGR